MAVGDLHLSSQQILDFFSDSHVVHHKDDTWDAVESLFSVVSDIMVDSIKIAEPNGDPLYVKCKGNPDLSNFKAPLDLLKKIACKMMDTKVDDDGNLSDAHRTTREILTLLAKDNHPWYARAVIALAAFALGYGSVCHLFDVKSKQGDRLGNSLATLNNVVVQTSGQCRNVYISMVRSVFLTVDCILSLEAMLIKGHYVDTTSTWGKAMEELPALVYYSVFTMVVCASSTDLHFGYPNINYEISAAVNNKISTLHESIERYLKKIEIERVERMEYMNRWRDAFQIPAGIVEVLESLLYPSDSSPNLVYCFGSSGVGTVPLNVLYQEKKKKKHALLFISGLNSIDYEIEVVKNVKINGARKDDFDIFWVPIVPDGVIEHYKDNGRKTELDQEFENVKAKLIRWSYVVHYSIIPSVCKKLIGAKLMYRTKPIVSVFDPRGRVRNDDALAMIDTWGDLAFPWTTGADSNLINMEWEWFWAKLKKVNQKIGDWIKEENYIIIYGGTDADGYIDGCWKKEFTDALKKINGYEYVQGKKLVVSYHRYEEVNRNTFWAFIQNFFNGTIKTKHSSLEEVQKFLGLRQEKSGWAILSKGRHIKLFARGDGFRQTVQDFRSWKQDIDAEGFDGCFGKRYDEVIKGFKDYTPCPHLELKGNVGDAFVSLYCATCIRPMEIKLLRYECCNGDSHPRPILKYSKAVTEIAVCHDEDFSE